MELFTVTTIFSFFKITILVKRYLVRSYNFLIISGITTINKTLTSSNLKRQLSSGSEGGGGFGVGGVRRWISLDELSPPQSNEEQSYVDYETYNDESVGSGSEYGLRTGNNIEAKKEKKQKKKSSKQSSK